MRAIVSGSAGFIGYHLCRRLLDDGFKVVGLDSFISGQRANIDELSRDARFSFVETDIARPFEVSGPLDHVYDFACPASPIDFEPHALEIMAVCSNGVRNMLELALAKQARFLHASTSECYGDPLVHPQNEDYWGHVNPIGPRAPYDEGKRFAEAMTMAYHRRHQMPTRLVRIFNTYGPRMRPSDGRALPNMINQALEGSPLTVYGDGSQTRSFCYVSDLIDGVIRLMNGAYALPVNIGNPLEQAIIDVARKVIEFCGSRSSIEFRPLPADDPRMRQPDIARARQLLSWEPKTPFDVGLRATIDYFRSLRTGSA